MGLCIDCSPVWNADTHIAPSFPPLTGGFFHLIVLSAGPAAPHFLAPFLPCLSPSPDFHSQFHQMFASPWCLCYVFFLHWAVSPVGTGNSVWHYWSTAGTLNVCQMPVSAGFTCGPRAQNWKRQGGLGAALQHLQCQQRTLEYAIGRGPRVPPVWGRGQMWSGDLNGLAGLECLIPSLRPLPSSMSFPSSSLTLSPLFISPAWVVMPPILGCAPFSLGTLFSLLPLPSSPPLHLFSAGSGVCGVSPAPSTVTGPVQMLMGSQFQDREHCGHQGQGSVMRPLLHHLKIWRCFVSIAVQLTALTDTSQDKYSDWA